MKIIISENKLEKLNEFLNSRGPLFVIRMIGGYNNFIKLFPDYFESKENKIKLLNELIENDDELEVNGRIYMSDITEKLILVGTDKTEYGTDLKFYIDYIKEDWATIQVWEFDKNECLIALWFTKWICFGKVKNTICFCFNSHIIFIWICCVLLSVAAR